MRWPVGGKTWIVLSPVPSCTTDHGTPKHAPRDGGGQVPVPQHYPHVQLRRQPHRLHVLQRQHPRLASSCCRAQALLRLRRARHPPEPAPDPAGHLEEVDWVGGWIDERVRAPPPGHGQIDETRQDNNTTGTWTGQDRTGLSFPSAPPPAPRNSPPGKRSARGR